MDAVTLILTVAFVAVLWKLLFRKSRQAYLLEKLPGPKPYPIVGNLLEVLSLPREKLFANFIEKWREHGTIFVTYLGPNTNVHISDPKYMEAVLSSNKHTRKGFIYKFLYPWLGTGLLTSDGQKWFKHRKMITPTFHFKILDTFLDIFKENTDILINKLENKAKTGEVFDVYPFITFCALDIICETAMGTKVNAQDSARSPYVSSIYSIARLTVDRNFKIWQQPDFLFYKTSSGKEYQKNLDILQGFTKKVIQERKQERKNRQENNSTTSDDIGIKKRQAFLDLLLEASENDQSARLTDVELREEVDTFMFEGHDTTTANICWTLFLLGHHPEIQDAVYEEVKSILGDDSTRNITMQDLNEMKLLERVIKESLRLYPSVPVIQRTLDEDTKIGEYLVPKDTTISLLIYMLHRNPEIYPNPDVFDPDRFLPENSAKRHPYAYLPFSAASRNCIGQKFALLEEKVILSKLIQNYKFKSVEKIEDMVVLAELVLRPNSGIKVQISKRV